MVTAIDIGFGLLVDKVVSDAGPARAAGVDGGVVRLLSGDALGLVECLVEIVVDCLYVLVADDALFEEVVGVGREDGGLVLDERIEEGLGEGGLVLLVMAILAVADEVDEEVFLESLAVLDGEVSAGDGGFWILGVDVQDGRLDELGDVGAVAAGAGVSRRGGEADEVVDDDMDRTADGVAIEQGEIEGLGGDTLAGEGGVAVDLERDDAFSIDIAPEALLGAASAEDEAVDVLKVAGVGRKGELERLAIAKCALA